MIFEDPRFLKKVRKYAKKHKCSMDAARLICELDRGINSPNMDPMKRALFIYIAGKLIETVKGDK